MTYADLVRKSVLTQPFYEGGRPIEEVAREHGIDPAGIIKLASNENPLGPSPLALAAAKKALEQTHLYPDGAAYAMRQKLAEKWNLAPSQFILGNGSNELLILLAQAFAGPGDEIVFGEYGFVVYRLAALMFGATPVVAKMPDYAHSLDALRAAITPRTRIIFIANPNNPTGSLIPAGDLLAFAKELPDHVILCVDEAYVEFLDAPADFRPLIAAGKKIVCTRTFSKIYGLAGLRIGYLYGAEEVVALLNRVRQPFNANLVAQAAALAALDDEEFVKKTRAMNTAGLAQLVAGFEKIGLRHVPSAGNFVVVHTPGVAAKVNLELQKRGVIVRPVANYGMPDSLRVTIGTPDQNARFLKELADILGK